MEFELPTIGEGVYEAELVRWLVKPGDQVKPGDVLAELLTDKATMELPAPFAGRIRSLRGEPGEKVTIGGVLLEYEPTSQQATAAEPRSVNRIAEPVEKQLAERPETNGSSLVATPFAVKASPSVRQMARKLGVDLTRVTGSGPDGRILIEDLSRQMVPPFSGRDMPVQRPTQPRQDYGIPGATIRLQGIRRKIAEHMVRSKRTIPHYSYMDECDVTELVSLRNSLKDTYARAGIRLTYLPFFVKAVVSALKEIPIVNSSLDEEGEEIHLHDRYNIGIAVATSGGLIVPVVKEADKKDLGTIAREIDRLSSDARIGKSKLEDLRGGTFTITSVGGIGGLISTPVINHPEVGILGLGKVIRRPVFDEAEQIVPADLLYLSFSFDHRVVDGAIGAVFSNAVIKHIKSPATLLLPDKL